MNGFRYSLAFLLVFSIFSVLGTSTQAQDRTGAITGTVFDETGDPLPGVNLTVVDAQRGTATNLEGKYTIGGLSPDTYTVRASFVGFVNQENEVTITPGDTKVVDFRMRPDVSRLDEVVVTGYTEQTRGELTGSVSKVEGDDISKIPTTSTTEALQGQVAGLNVTPSSGEPGASAQLRIRGVGTLNDASPLFVVDGVQTDDISFLNSQDIESVDVLKDASSTALYGSRGANGVIVITTKQGTLNQETQFSVNAYTGWSEVMDPIELTNARQYATLANELRQNQGQEPVFQNPDSFGEGTDWQEQVYRTARTNNLQASARGGTETITYNFSGNFTREEGVMRKSDFTRATFRANNTYQLSDRLELGHNLSFTYRESTPQPGVTGNAYRADPTISPRNDQGEFSDAGIRASAGNPDASIFFHRDESQGRRFVGNLYLKGTFLNHFTLESRFNTDLNRSESRGFDPEFLVSSTQMNDRSRLTRSRIEEDSWLWENTLTYDQDFGEHSVEVTGVGTAQQFDNEVLGGTRFGIPGENEDLLFLDAAPQEGQTNFNSAFDWSILSGLGRINYAFRDRYLLTASLRADGSSRFGEENRWGYFPSVSGGWRISEEPFMDQFGFVDNLKVRASWGEVGNDKIGAFPSTATVGSNINAVFGEPEGLQFGAALTELANPEVKWEETTQTNVGLDVSVLESRLSASVEYYRRTTDGILVRVPIPDFVGAAPPVVNAAEVRNSGFDLQIDWSQNLTNDLSFDIGVTGSTTENEVQGLGQGREEIFGGGLVNEIPFTTRTTVGSEIGAFFGFKVNGVYQNEEQIANNPSQPGVEPGDLNFRDVNGDGQITSEDKTTIGSAIPDFTYGINLNVEYRAFDLSVSLNGERGRDIFNAKKATRFGIENFETSFLDRWQGEGTSNSEPRIGNPGHNWFTASEWLLEDGNFLKIRDVRLGYTLPESLTASVGMTNLRLYASGTNLVTFTDYSGYTPEIAGGSVISNSIDSGVFPLQSTYTVGINMSF